MTLICGKITRPPEDHVTNYRTGTHWGVTIVRDGPGPEDAMGRHSGDELVAVVVNGDQALAERICALLNADDETVDVIRNLGTVRAAAESLMTDSCTCGSQPDPACVVHHGRRARGPKPPNPPGCVCDGSGRTCPRHGAVL